MMGIGYIPIFVEVGLQVQEKQIFEGFFLPYMGLAVILVM